MKVAAAPIIWSNDDMPELGGDIPLRQCLSEMQMAGYEGCEIGNKYPEDVEELKDLLAEFKLQICNQWFSYRLSTEPLRDNLHRLEKMVSKLSALGCQVIGGAEVGNSWHQDSTPILNHTRKISLDIRNKVINGLGECAKLIEDHGMQLAYHPHMGTMIQSDTEVIDFLEDCSDTIMLNFDCGHCYFSGGDPVVLYQEIAERVVHIHLKDVRPKVLDHVRMKNLSFLEAVRLGVFTVPGDKEGTIDFDELLQVIKQSDYDKWLVVEAEQDPYKAPPLQYATIGRRYLWESHKI